MDAQEALRLKLVDYVVPANEVFDYSLAFLKRLTGDKPMQCDSCSCTILYQCKEVIGGRSYRKRESDVL